MAERVDIAYRVTEAAIAKGKTIHPKKGRLRIGSELAALGRRFAGVDLKIEREQTPPESPNFGRDEPCQSEVRRVANPRDK